MLKIAVVGDVGIDYYENLDLQKPGGIAFNFAYNLTQCGIKKVALVSVLGSDENSDELLKLIEHINIDSTHIQKFAGSPPKQNISLKNGERKFTGYSPGVLKKWKLRKEDLEFIKKYDAVFIPLSDGMENIFNAIKTVKGPIKTVDFSQDYEYADFEKEDNLITKNVKHFDLIFVGGEKRHRKMVQSLANKYPEKVFILTLGKNGSLAFHEGKKSFQPALKIKKFVDTTGCGDAFQAGFLVSWLEKKNIELALFKGTERALSVLRHIGSTELTLK